jgi:hypothetical protein
LAIRWEKDLIDFDAGDEQRKNKPRITQITRIRNTSKAPIRAIRVIRG